MTTKTNRDFFALDDQPSDKPVNGYQNVNARLSEVRAMVNEVKKTSEALATLENTGILTSDNYCNFGQWKRGMKADIKGMLEGIQNDIDLVI